MRQERTIQAARAKAGEMDDAEILYLLDVLIGEIRDMNGRLLIGILKTNAEEAAESIACTLS